MHNQHRSPDPTKIERATATSTVALFFYFFKSEKERMSVWKTLPPREKTSINPHVEKQREQVPLTSVRGAELPPRSLLCPKHCLSSTSTTSNPKLTQGLAQARQQLVPQPIPAHKDTAMSLARSSSTKQ